MALKKSINKSLYPLAVARICLGLTFLWAFLDKLFGLGFSTCRDKTTNAVQVACSKAWIHGGSPTVGFLKFGTKGPFASFYQALAGHAAIDWLFMMGCLLIGVALITGIGVKIAAWSGSLLLLMMWSAGLFPESNPLIDEHVIYIALLMTIGLASTDQKWSLLPWWQKQTISQKLPFIQ